MPNQFTEKFAKLGPEGQEREQLDEIWRLEAGEMGQAEWTERSDAWRELARRDFDPEEMWERARQRIAENAKRKPWDRVRS